MRLGLERTITGTQRRALLERAAWRRLDLLTALCRAVLTVAVVTTLAALIASLPAVADKGRSPLAPSKAAPAAAEEPAPAVAGALRIETSGPQTRLTLEVDGPIQPTVFLVANPPRLIVDVPDLSFRLPADAARTVKGLVASVRYGLLAPRRSRLVVETTGPVRITRSELVSAAGSRKHELVLALAATDPASFAATVVEDRPAATAPAIAGSRFEDIDPAARPAKPRPVVVIDPGHGGVDPGALGTNGVLEKNIVLAVAREVKSILADRKRYDIVMTRATDVFVSLDNRVEISSAADADLFVSIHADSLSESDLARNIRGATVYTLSERASDEQARRLAEKENAADLIAGLPAGSGKEADDVRDILIDLLRRETANNSMDLRSILVAELKKSIAMARDPQRSAAFRVLKQPKAPSVLIELGYMSNPQDQALMTTAEWQKKVAASIARAIEAYLGRHLAAGGR